MKQVEDKYSDVLVNAFTKPDERFFENCESVKEFVDRTGNTINKIVENNIGNRIIIVTYPEVIQAAIISALDLPVNRISQPSLLTQEVLHK